MDIRKIKPREQSGRDTMARYKSQFKAAALQCLKILDCKEVKRVYCDYHDDFVVQISENGETKYEFYQVKTQSNESKPIPLFSVFGLNKRKPIVPDEVANSFAGKMVLHTFNFKNSCKSVCLLTNAQFDDAILEIEQDIKSANFSSKLMVQLISTFPNAFSAHQPFSISDIHSCLQKIRLESGQAHLRTSDDYFFPVAREAIFTYSEIDLNRGEAKAIIDNICSLVEKKSTGVLIDGISPGTLDSTASIDISDLLGILSLSVDAFEILRSGGDQRAIKSTSILHRILKKSNFSDGDVVFCAQCKVDYDAWHRQHRHHIQPVELNQFERMVARAFSAVSGKVIEMDAIHSKVKEMTTESAKFSFHSILTQEILFGGILGELVKAES